MPSGKFMECLTLLVERAQREQSDLSSHYDVVAKFVPILLPPNDSPEFV